MRRPPVPSHVRLALLALRRHAVLAGFAIAFGAAGSLFAIVPWGMEARDRAVVESGGRAHAVVTDLWVYRDSEDGDEFGVDYTFETPAAVLHDGSTSALTDDAWATLRVGDTVVVAYAPEEPQASFLIDNGLEGEGGFTSRSATILFSGFGLLFCVLPGLIGWGLLVRGPSQWRRLLLEGSPAEATVLEVETHDDNDGLVRVRYGFVDRFGAEQEDETEWMKTDRLGDWAVGDTAVALYDRREPETHILVDPDDPLRFYA